MADGIEVADNSLISWTFGFYYRKEV